MRLRCARFVPLLCLAGCFAQSPRALAPDPHVDAPATRFDFGEVWAGDEVRHRFAVRNGGRLPLTLAPKRVECACSAAVHPGSTLASGETGWLEVAFDTAGESGERVRTVVVETNDPVQPELLVTLHGTVLADVAVSPTRAFFGRVPRGRSRELVLEVAVAPGVRIQKVQKVSPRFGLRVEKPSAEGDPLRVHVALRAQSRRGPFDDVLEIETSSARQPTVKVPVLGFIE